MITKEKQLKREMIFLLIVRKRNEMIQIANRNGLSSEETIKCSQELDILLNTFNKFQLNQL